MGPRRSVALLGALAVLGLASAGGGAAAQAVPAVRAAASTAYQPLTVTDPAGDVRSLFGADGKTYDKAFIDLTGLHGEHYRRWLSVVVTYRDLRPSTYTRHSLAVIDPTSHLGNLLELRSGADPDTTRVTLYPLDDTGENEGGTINPTGCATGVRATPSYRHNTITYALPLSCYAGTEPGSANFGAGAEKWSSRTWEKGVVDTRHSADLYDAMGGVWDWTIPAGTS